MIINVNVNDNSIMAMDMIWYGMILIRFKEQLDYVRLFKYVIIWLELT